MYSVYTVLSLLRRSLALTSQRCCRLSDLLQRGFVVFVERTLWLYIPLIYQSSIAIVLSYNLDKI